VNLSSRQLMDPELTGRVRAAIEAHGLDEGQLWMEITETAALLDLHGVADVLTELRAAGVCLALDDFGAGYSTLNWLRHLPVDGVKIDRSFVAGVAPVDAAVCAAVIAIGEQLGLSVVAEGVETPEERRLSDLGCPLVQGYLYAKPAPLDVVRQQWADAPSGRGSVPDGTPVERSPRHERAVALALPLS
jgi:EAL domain-containing protein (putative c-di-GMP-specific phosphodiesterase class I)